MVASSLVSPMWQSSFYLVLWSWLGGVLLAKPSLRGELLLPEMSPLEGSAWSVEWRGMVRGSLVRGRGSQGSRGRSS